jgi:hypothetical protein
MKSKRRKQTVRRFHFIQPNSKEAPEYSYDFRLVRLRGVIGIPHAVQIEIGSYVGRVPKEWEQLIANHLDEGCKYKGHSSNRLRNGDVGVDGALYVPDADIEGAMHAQAKIVKAGGGCFGLALLTASALMVAMLLMS